MPRQKKKNTIIPLPSELQTPKETPPPSKVEIALQKSKEIKNTPDNESDTDDEVEYDDEFVIEPIKKATPPPTQKFDELITLPEPTETKPPVEPTTVKPKRKYTKRPKQEQPQTQPQSQLINSHSIDIVQQQIDTLKKENEMLKSHYTLNHLSKINNLARMMKIKF